MERRSGPELFADLSWSVHRRFNAAESAMPTMSPNRLSNRQWHCRYIVSLWQDCSHTLPIYWRCLKRQCLRRMPSKTANISATLPIYWRCLTAHCRYIGGALVDLLHGQIEHTRAVYTRADYLWAVYIYYTADLLAMKLAMPCDVRYFLIIDYGCKENNISQLRDDINAIC